MKEILSKNIKNIVFSRDESGRSGIQLAAANGQVEAVKLFLAQDPETSKIVDNVICRNTFHIVLVKTPIFLH